MTRLRPRLRDTIPVALNAGIAVALLGCLSLATRTPFLFPALGATTFILFCFPESPAASSRNVIGAHVVAAAAGWACFRLCGLEAGGPTLLAGGGAPHVLAAALALSTTTVLLLFLGLHHPPAGATTLIVSLGFLPHVWQIGVVGASATMLVAWARLVPELRQLILLPLRRLSS